MPAADPDRIVRCRKLEKDLPGLVKAPFPNELGNWIFENLSKEAWDQWLQESVRYINTYGWQLDKPADAEKLVEQLKIWLGLTEGEMVQTAWTPPKAGAPQKQAPEDA